MTKVEIVGKVISANERNKGAVVGILADNMILIVKTKLGLTSGIKEDAIVKIEGKLGFEQGLGMLVVADTISLEA